MRPPRRFQRLGSVLMLRETSAVTLTDFGLLEQIDTIAKRAGAAIMDIYETDFDVEAKGDDSPVTQADQVAEAMIIKAIKDEVESEYPIVGEEDAAAGNMPDISGGVFWLVDPLDGTKEFIKKNGEFTVNIALIEAGQPVLGVVHLPAKDETFLGADAGAYKQEGEGALKPITVRNIPIAGLTAVASRSHPSPEVEAYLTHFQIAERISAGSSLKFCRVAEGAADIYPRFGRTMEWDTAAGHAVLRFAGGRVVREDGTDLTYGKPGLENPNFIAIGQGVDPVVG